MVKVLFLFYFFATMAAIGWLFAGDDLILGLIGAGVPAGLFLTGAYFAITERGRNGNG